MATSGDSSGSTPNSSAGRMSGETAHDSETVSYTDAKTSVSRQDSVSETHKAGDGGAQIAAENAGEPAAERAAESAAAGPASAAVAAPEDDGMASAEAQEIACKLFHEQFVSISPEEYTQFLASPDAESAAVRQHYMDLFSWDGNLLKATRTLCAKLHLKGESQEIDRLLSAFTRSYLKQHPRNVFCTRDFEKIYIVLYSLILLNTALHNSGVAKKARISQAAYIQNTFSTFLSQNKTAKPLPVKARVSIERELGKYYDDLAKHELHLKQTVVEKRVASDPRRELREVLKETKESSELKEPKEPKEPNEPKEAKELKKEHKEPAHAPEECECDEAREAKDELFELFSDPLADTSLAFSSASLWSTDAESLADTTRISNSSAAAAGPRFGFTRALLSEPAPPRNGSFLRGQSSLDHLRRLSTRTSQASLMTRDSGVSASATDLSHLNLATSNDRADRYEVGDFDVADFQDRYDLELELRGSPYLKEGLLKLKIANNDSADSAAPEAAAVSSAASAVSIGSGRTPGFLSFFGWGNKDAAGSPLGTSSIHTFNKATEYFVVVSKGELRLYSFDPKIVRKHQQKQKKLRTTAFFNGEPESDVGDGNWLNNAANIGNYNLCSTVAHMEKQVGQGHTAGKAHWILTFPKVSRKPPKTFYFEAGTVDIANEFVGACNFWASKLTAVPALEESMSSIEYGWSNLDALIAMGDAFKKTKNISRWESLPKGVYLSNIVSSQAMEGEKSKHEAMMKQFMQTLKYYNNLKTVHGTFAKQKAHFVRSLRRFSRCSNYKLVAANYQAKNIEYKAELARYKQYVVMLGYGLKLRFELEDSDAVESWLTEFRSGFGEGESAADLVERRRREARAQESELAASVRKEIDRLAQSSSQMKELLAGDVMEPEVDSDTLQASLVKSPGTYSLAGYHGDDHSPVSQLLSMDDRKDDLELVKNELIMSFSTNTIREEDEPEEPAA